MTQLNQIIAVEKGTKVEAERAFTAAYHEIQQTAQFTGIARTYVPKDDDGDLLPAESTLVQRSAETILDVIAAGLTRLFDVTLTKDFANTEAKADVKVGDTVVLEQVPVTYLLFLEKKLVDLATVVSKLPTLTPDRNWSLDPTTGIYVADPVQTTRTNKMLRNHVKYEATDKHPAQVDTYTEDVIVGYWTTIHSSGAISPLRKAELLERISALSKAVTFAREEANSRTVTDQKAGDAVFAFLFAPPAVVVA